MTLACLVTVTVDAPPTRADKSALQHCEWHAECAGNTVAKLQFLSVSTQGRAHYVQLKTQAPDSMTTRLFGNVDLTKSAGAP